MYTVNEKWNENDAGVLAVFQKHALKDMRYRWVWLTFPVRYITTYGMSPSYHGDSIFNNAKVMDGLK